MTLRLPIATRYPDFDTKGHVNNAIYLTYFEMARHAAWVDHLKQDPDFPFVVAEATVRYVSQAHIGDTLQIEIATTEVRTKAWAWSYRIIDARDERLVADGRTVQVMYDYDARHSIPIPEHVRQLLQRV